MNSISFSSPIQPLFNPSHKSSNQSLPSNFLFNSIHTHIKTSQIPNGKPPLTTAKASSTSRTAAPENQNYQNYESCEKYETLYDLLGISEDVTISEIKQAYKKMALKYHPDVSPADRAEEYTVRFIRVQEAYETLSDPETRSVYDSCMAKGLGFGGLGIPTRVDPRSGDKGRWKEMWKGQLSELMRRSEVGRGGGMSWAARIRKQRSESGGNGSGSGQ